MYRYCVLLWNRADNAAAAAARFAAGRLCGTLSEWELALDADGILALHSGAGSGSCETRILTGQSGAVLGRLFEAGREIESVKSVPRAIEREESTRIIATRCAHLVEHYWGRYVAVGRDPARDEAFVLRDPSGGLPCYITSWRDVTIVFSDIECCLALDSCTFSINWKYIAAFVPYSALQIRDTGLNEVSELQAGERFTIDGRHIGRELIWNPLDVARRDPIEDPHTAVEAVRRTVERCVHAWASLHRSVIHNLSGGLDSSIVLSCLKTAPTTLAVTCLHYYSPSTNEDERKYARLMAAHSQAALVEAEVDGARTSLERLSNIRRAPKPWFYVYDLLHSPVEARLAAERGATGIFSGAGGDSLFLQARADLAVADYLRRHGFRPGALSVALDAARITRTSLWPILRKGVARHLRRVSSSPAGEHADARSLIPEDVLKAAREDHTLVHPWIRASRDPAPGLLWQVLCLSVPPAFYDCFAGEADIERTPVLVSQPLIELCLRIPSYVWIGGGRDRAIARRAFADALPPLIARRQQKGGIDRVNLSLFDANEAYLREMLLDGLLVREGLLDRERLERFLRRGAVRDSFEYNDVLRHHLCTEVWLRQWSHASHRAAA